jgi:hypothetical protein
MSAMNAITSMKTGKNWKMNLPKTKAARIAMKKATPGINPA